MNLGNYSGFLDLVILIIGYLSLFIALYLYNWVGST